MPLSVWKRIPGELLLRFSSQRISAQNRSQVLRAKLRLIRLQMGPFNSRLGAIHRHMLVKENISFPENLCTRSAPPVPRCSPDRAFSCLSPLEINICVWHGLQIDHVNDSLPYSKHVMLKGGISSSVVTLAVSKGEPCYSICPVLLNFTLFYHFSRCLSQNKYIKTKRGGRLRWCLPYFKFYCSVVFIRESRNRWATGNIAVTHTFTQTFTTMENRYWL